MLAILHCVARRRYPPPDELELAVARRVRQVRTEYRLSRRAVAERILLTPDQLNRVESGDVALRFGPGWKFCELTQTNPLWLAFGDHYPRIGFIQIPRITELETAAPFLATMMSWGRAYADHRSELLKDRQIEEVAFAHGGIKIKMLVEAGVKRYLALSMLPPTTWDELRSKLKSATRAPGTRAALARSFGVTTAAVSQWLSGASAPRADTALRLLQWVTAAEANQKKSAGALTPAEDLKSKSKRYEKAKSGPRKK